MGGTNRTITPFSLKITVGRVKGNQSLVPFKDEFFTIKFFVRGMGKLGNLV